MSSCQSGEAAGTASECRCCSLEAVQADGASYQEVLNFDQAVSDGNMLSSQPKWSQDILRCDGLNP